MILAAAFNDFPGTSLTLNLKSHPEVPQKFPTLPSTFPSPATLQWGHLCLAKVKRTAKNRIAVACDKWKSWVWLPRWEIASDLRLQCLCQESAKGAGGKGARVINCHNFFSSPQTQGNKENRPRLTTEGTAERKMRQFATPAPFTPAPFRPLQCLWRA